MKGCIKLIKGIFITEEELDQIAEKLEQIDIETGSLFNKLSGNIPDQLKRINKYNSDLIKLFKIHE